MTVNDTNDGKNDFIETYKENKFLFHPDEVHLNSFDIEDIAHPLSMNCRYNGHVHTFYSVAEHCCLLYDFVLGHYGTKAYEAWGGWTYKKAFQLLMHDSSEAFICDMPSPMKRFMPDVKNMEYHIETAIFKYYDLPMQDAFVKELDTRILIDERQQGMNGTGKYKWFYEDLKIVPLGVELKFWNPERAEFEFLERFNHIKPLYDSVKDDLKNQRRT